MSEAMSRLSRFVSQFRYLFQTFASNEVRLQYLKGHFSNRYATPALRDRKIEFMKIVPSLSTSYDWFTPNIPRWLRVLDDHHLAQKHGLQVLEIGSWEGLSAYFILHTLPNATLTCVDTWEGSDEHKTGPFSKEYKPNKVEQSFDSNLAPFRDRLNKQKCTSFSFFANNSGRDQFDLIYVDGSHYTDDVLIDAVKCFEMLKIGGLMIFDDYFWRLYPNPLDNPAAAINLFLRLKHGAYKLIDVSGQVTIQKISDRP